MFGLGEFKKFVKTSAGDVKPVVILSVDGGPDENSRYAKVVVVYYAAYYMRLLISFCLCR